MMLRRGAPATGAVALLLAVGGASAAVAPAAGAYICSGTFQAPGVQPDDQGGSAGGARVLAA